MNNTWDGRYSKDITYALKLAYEIIYAAAISFNIISISMHPLLWINDMLFSFVLALSNCEEQEQSE